MEWSPCIHEVLENAPGEWPLTSILAFAEKAVISANYRSHSQELKKAVSQFHVAARSVRTRIISVP